MKCQKFGARSFCLGILILISYSCKSRENSIDNGSEERAMITGNSQITFFSTLNDSSVCLYEAKNNGGAISSARLRGLLQESSTSVQGAKYVNVDSLLSTASKMIDGNIENEIAANPSFQTSRSLGLQHNKLYNDLNGIITADLGGGSYFGAVYERKIAGKSFCRGALGFGVNQDCQKNFPIKLNQLQEPLRKYLDFLAARKKEGRLEGVSSVKTFDQVYNKKPVKDFGMVWDINTETFMTSSEKQILSGLRSESQRLQQQVLSAYASASKTSDAEPAMPVKTQTSVATREDGSKVTTVTTIKDGGLSNLVQAEGRVQANLRAAFASLQQSASGPACPNVTKLSEGLEFDVNTETTAAPKPPAEPDPVIYVQLRYIGTEVSVDLPDCNSTLHIVENITAFQFAVEAGQNNCAHFAVKQFDYVGDGNNNENVVTLNKAFLQANQRCFTLHVLSRGALEQLRPNGQFGSDDNVDQAKAMDIVEICRVR